MVRAKARRSDYCIGETYGLQTVKDYITNVPEVTNNSDVQMMPAAFTVFKCGVLNECKAFSCITFVLV